MREVGAKRGCGGRGQAGPCPAGGAGAAGGCGETRTAMGEAGGRDKAHRVAGSNPTRDDDQKQSSSQKGQKTGKRNHIKTKKYQNHNSPAPPPLKL